MVVLAVLRLSEDNIKSTLTIYLDPTNNDSNYLRYSYRGSWSPEGTPFGIENLIGKNGELPVCAIDYPNVFSIVEAVKPIIGSSIIKKIHIVNDTPSSNLSESEYLLKRKH